ncbi:helix-turn-helix domain-containing protein [Micromonospora sp. HUAS LYJ1]|uniref:helix-turn-helix domain-containing protein n=1 Tax=Micromonospora sp. HUAS LYJ1 TaxID=3061626 RepID=UPI002673B39C|nr:helix-turn-helix domain-containing protein [Micromonospora sp. HUAS LYJ1]WKU03972.1 helix-turn-helix domain-containing protein [Micromonospora sp. HUAS LYJ1]
MTAAARVMDEQTILPDATNSAEVVDLLQVLRDRGHNVPEARARLVSADGTSTMPLPDGLHDILVKALETLASGYAVTIAPQHTTLTTQQAADMLGVSRPTLTKLLDEGKIPHERPSSHRRIRLADVLKYQEQRRQERRRLLQSMTTESLAMGLYDLPVSDLEEGVDNRT